MITARYLKFVDEDSQPIDTRTSQPGYLFLYQPQGESIWQHIDVYYIAGALVIQGSPRKKAKIEKPEKPEEIEQAEE